MSLRVLEIPDAPADLAVWLERWIIGLDLGSLVADLEVVHSKKGNVDPPSLETALGERLPAVLRGGLRQGTRTGLSLLLRHPNLLLDLQERLLTEGGPYWTNLAREDQELSKLVAATLPELAATNRSPAPVTAERKRRGGRTDARASTAAEPAPRLAKPPRVGLIRFWARVATIAASAMVFLYLAENFDKIMAHFDPDGTFIARLYPKGTRPLRRSVPAPEIKIVGEAPWGWSRTGVFARATTPAEALNNIADAAGEWYDEVPFSSEALAKRLGEFRVGMSQLRLAEHDALPSEEKSWLLEQSKAWAEVIDTAIQAVEEGRGVDEIRNTTDDAVSLMIRLLHDRAKALEGAGK